MVHIEYSTTEVSILRSNSPNHIKSRVCRVLIVFIFCFVLFVMWIGEGQVGRFRRLRAVRVHGAQDSPQVRVQG